MIEITTSPHPVEANQKDRLRRIKAFFSLVYRYGMIQSRWIMKMNTLEEVKAALFTIRSWNTFKANAVYEAVKELWDEVLEVYIGCEGSPVMYISCPFWISQHPKGARLLKKLPEEEIVAIFEEYDWMEAHEEISKRMGNRKLTDEEREEIKEKIFKSFPEATELDIVERLKTFPAPLGSIRIWWD